MGILKLYACKQQMGPSTCKMDSRAQIDFLATLRLSLKVLKKAEPGFSVDELLHMIEARIAELKAEAGLQRKPASPRNTVSYLQTASNVRVLAFDICGAYAPSFDPRSTDGAESCEVVLTIFHERQVCDE